MVAGSNFTGFGTSSFPAYTGSRGGGNSGALESVAKLILDTFGVYPHNVVDGSPLAGYDIKSQDALTMLRLSLIAQDPVNLKEVYVNSDGVVTTVAVGVDPAPISGECISEQLSVSDVARTDYVVVRGRDPLPTRYVKATVNATNGSVGVQPRYPLVGFPVPWNKQAHLFQQAWVEFNNSPQDPVIQNLLRTIIRRDRWESLVGYIMHLPPLPAGVSFSLSATTPRNIFINYLGGFTSQITINPGAQVVDVGGITAIGAPVLDIQTGAEIASKGGTTDGLSIAEDAYYILLSPEYGLNELSRGQNWWLLPGAGGTIQVLISRGTGTDKASQALGNILQSDRSDQYIFRSSGPGFESFQDIIDNNIRNNRQGLSLLGDGLAAGTFAADLVEGLGTSLGYELATSLLFSYTVQRPSIALKSENTLLLQRAIPIAARGIYMTPIVTQDLPLPIALNGELVQLPAPFDEETNPIIQDSIFDTLIGSILDITLPIFGATGAQEFSALLFQSLNAEDAGTNVTKVYESGSYNVLPGQVTEDGVVLSVEYTYSDQNSVTTSITTGPRYYPVQSFNDSQYVKRAETLSRRGTIISGNNATGQFTVSVDGFGQLQALNSVMKPLYPGDSVEVRILNSPIER